MKFNNSKQSLVLSACQSTRLLTKDALVYWLLTAILVCQAPLLGQNVSNSNAPEITQSYTLSVLRSGVPSDVQLFYRVSDLAKNQAAAPQNAEALYSPLPIGVSSRGEAIRFRTGVSASLYRQSKNPDTQDFVYQPVIDIPTAAPGDRLLLALYRDVHGKGGFRFIDDSLEAHPTGTVRAINLSPFPTAISIGADAVITQPGAEQLLGEPAYSRLGRFLFRYAFQTDDATRQSPGARVPLRQEDQRLLLIMSFVERKLDDGSKEGLTRFKPRLDMIYDQTEAGNRTTNRPSTGSAGESRVQTMNTNQIEVRLVDLNSDNKAMPAATIRSSVGQVWLPSGSAGRLPKQLKVGTKEEELELQLSEKGRSTFRISPQWKRVLLAATKSDQTTVHAFENSEQSHPSGHYRLFNLSPYQLGYAIDQSVKYLSPMESALLPRSDDRRIELSLALKTPGGWKSIAKEEPPVLEANQRFGLFISDTEGNGNFSLNSIEL
jgi:hypothetical protein